MRNYVHLQFPDEHLEGAPSVSNLCSLHTRMGDGFNYGFDSSTVCYFRPKFRIWTISNDGEIARVAYTRTCECPEHERVDTTVIFGWFRREGDTREDFVAWNPIGERTDQSKIPDLVQQAKAKVAAILVKHPRGLTLRQLLEQYGFGGHFTERQFLKLLRSMPHQVWERKILTHYSLVYFPPAPTPEKTAVEKEAA